MHLHTFLNVLGEILFLGHFIFHCLNPLISPIWNVSRGCNFIVNPKIERTLD